MAWWFGGKRQRAITPEAPRPAPPNALAEKVYAFLLDEELQNARLPPALRAEIDRTQAADQVPNRAGEFGRDLRNPVPVNGPFGAAQYLSSLVTAEGQPIAFHRLATVAGVDVFETVSLDGRTWDCLYLATVFPRKSHLAPSGFRFASEEERSVLIRGTTDNAEDFPADIHALVEKFTKRTVGVSIADPRLKVLQAIPISLPEDHRIALQRLRFGGGS